MGVVSGFRLWEWRNVAIESAIASDIPPAEIDWLLLEVTELDRLALRLESFKNQPQIELQLPFEDLELLWKKRLTERLPVQYITGITPWRQFRLRVSPAVLIPRPETEFLIDLAVERVKLYPGLNQGNWVDLGTGSGAIALGLAGAFPGAIFHAVDVSSDALAIAQQNARDHQLEHRIKFYQGSWWEPLVDLKGKITAMVSNPPYIPTETVLTLQPEVVNHEPHLALDGGIDGLDDIRHLVEMAPTYLEDGGLWMVEMMQGQAEAIYRLLETQGSYENIEIRQDLAGIERYAIANKKYS
ncbi:peptide chain release factor N(5)-glutamine methyltransferase [Calothrix sp. PCC 6303]|uniref:peptide chain release factor N(5)-glutamine methyltransferase n=1 Tax=Calothrix sp. PCC 6303 TaxID=1170562 RepID=UPI0002A013E0|nr:peptide chain release factor N(5)-glutamine methyltransferase [Calothrix sp. PCC 6303]AFZ03670.1 protein-(glutamine-N5) methyltransferase, release factor-specific [Calothrix sp. PCC 6303]